MSTPLSNRSLAIAEAMAAARARHGQLFSSAATASAAGGRGVDHAAAFDISCMETVVSTGAHLRETWMYSCVCVGTAAGAAVDGRPLEAESAVVPLQVL